MAIPKDLANALLSDPKYQVEHLHRLVTLLVRQNGGTATISRHEYEDLMFNPSGSTFMSTTPEGDIYIELSDKPGPVITNEEPADGSSNP